MNDQTIKADAGKPRLTLVPRKAAFRVAKVREYGLMKYPEGGPDNWKRVEIERYRDAMMRHLYAYLDDPFSRDTESGLLHFDQFLTNAFFLAELEPDEPSRIHPDQSGDGSAIWCGHYPRSAPEAARIRQQFYWQAHYPSD